MAGQGGNGQPWAGLGIVLAVIGTLATVMHQRASVTEAGQADVESKLGRASDALHGLEITLEKAKVELAAFEKLRVEGVGRLDRIQAKQEAIDNAVTAIGEKLKEIETQFREARSFTTLSDDQIRQRIDASVERLSHVERLIQNGPDSIDRRLGVLEASGTKGGQ